MARSIIYLGNPILRKKASPVEALTDEIKTLVNEMFEAMEEKNGIGLAAPQIGVSLRLFVMQVDTPGEEPDTWITGERRVFINPVLSNPSEETWDMEEGCLSIPKLYATVTRPHRVTVEYTKLDGSRVKETFSGLEARCIMHENDHINGTLFIDRLSPQEKKRIEPELLRLKKNLNS